MKKPKVLLLGYNYASVMHSLAEGFKQAGVPCRALSFEVNRSIFIQYGNVDCVYHPGAQSRAAITWQRLKGIGKLLRFLAWCDVIHVIYDTGITGRSFELDFFRRLKKKKFINFLGSDIRNPKVSLERNPYFHLAFNDPGYEYRHESEAHSDGMQLRYARAGFLPIVFDTDIYINKKIFPQYFIVPHASFNHLQPAASKKEGPVLIVHSPSASVAKGTKYVLAAVEKLKAKGITGFEFRLLRGISNDQYQASMQQADILVDQLIWGAYGIAAVQALAFGKVVVCYLLPERMDRYYGPDCPIVNATVDNLAEELEGLISDEFRRKDLEEKGKAYYQKMHAPATVAQKMLNVYAQYGEGSHER